MVNCTDFQCPRESHFKKQNIGENVSCDGDDDDDNDNCKEKCCNQYTICGEWCFHDNECRNGKYPSPSRTLPSDIYDDKDIYNLSVENVCCDNVKCSDYTCPEGYKDKVKGDEGDIEEDIEEDIEDRLMYSKSGFYRPNDRCCKPKDCDDWKSDGNSCYPFLEFSGVDRPGYSEDKCCYKLCSRWKEHRQRELDEPMKKRLNYLSITELYERAIYEVIPDEDI